MTQEDPGATVLSELFGLSGKVALVTGGSRGIGEMIATGLVRAGVKTYVSSRKAEACEAVAAELTALGPGECIPIAADLSREEECVRLAEELGRREERLHILVNNAGANWAAPLAQYDGKAFDRVLDLNLKGVFLLTRSLRPLLDAAGTPDDPARVINVGSIDGIQSPSLETFAYSSSKAAVHHLTHHLAVHLAPKITVNAIAPGPFQSKMMAATLEAFGDQIAAGAPMKRIGRPDDMAGTVIFLAGRAGSYLTGTVIPVDGGITVK